MKFEKGLGDLRRAAPPPHDYLLHLPRPQLDANTPDITRQTQTKPERPGANTITTTTATTTAATKKNNKRSTVWDNGPGIEGEADVVASHHPLGRDLNRLHPDRLDNVLLRPHVLVVHPCAVFVPWMMVRVSVAVENGHFKRQLPSFFLLFHIFFSPSTMQYMLSPPPFFSRIVSHPQSAYRAEGCA